MTLRQTFGGVFTKCAEYIAYAHLDGTLSPRKDKEIAIRGIRHIFSTKPGQLLLSVAQENTNPTSEVPRSLPVVPVEMSTLMPEPKTKSVTAMTTDLAILHGVN